MAVRALLFAFALLPCSAEARLDEQRAARGRDLEEPEHIMPHPDLPGTPSSPEQGYVGEKVSHTNFETATGNWTMEYGPTPKPTFEPYVPPPTQPAPVTPEKP